MLPASNRGAGMNLCFPDVCLTPTPGGPVPIPYPNMAFNAQATGFATSVKVSGLHALNVGSTIPVTTGDEPGTAHPTFKGRGAYTTGSPVVSINKLPAVTLTCQTTGNNMNGPVGAVVVPSAVNVLFCDLRAGCMDNREVLGLALLPDGVAVLALRVVPSDAAPRVYAAMQSLAARGVQSWVLDLRGNPGGDLDAALAVAAEFLPRGALLVERVDAEGDVRPVRSQNPSPEVRPLVVLVDGGTASAAELLAGALQYHGRATLVGEPTYGKGSAHAVVGYTLEGGSVLAPAAQCVVPGHTRAGEPLRPDHACAPGEALTVALSVLAQPSR